MGRSARRRAAVVQTILALRRPEVAQQGKTGNHSRIPLAMSPPWAPPPLDSNAGCVCGNVLMAVAKPAWLGTMPTCGVTAWLAISRQRRATYDRKISVVKDWLRRLWSSLRHSLAELEQAMRGGGGPPTRRA